MMRPSPSLVRRAIVVGPLYFALASLPLLLTRFEGGVAFIWVANAFLVAALATDRARRFETLAVCSVTGLLAASFFGLGVRSAVPLVAVNMGEALATVILLDRLGLAARHFDTVRGVALFVAVAAGAVPLVFGVGGAGVVTLATGTAFVSNWMHWWAGHALGAITVTPVALLLLGREVRGGQRCGAIEHLGLFGLVALTTAGVFGQSRLPLLFLPTLPMMFATVRLGRVGAAGATVILTAGGALLTLKGHGPITLIHAALGVQTLFFQFYIAVCSLLVLPVAALLEEQSELLFRIEQEEQRFRLLAEHSTDAVLKVTPDGFVCYASPAVAEVAGFAPDAIVGRDAIGLVLAEDAARVAGAHRQAEVRPGSVVAVEHRIRTHAGEERWVETRSRAVVDDDGRLMAWVNAVRDISQRKTLEAALTSARRHAEAAAAAKSAFLANMSHEIRTPMNGVIGFTDLLLETGLDADQRRQVGLIADSGRAMMRLLNDILDISKIEAGQMRLHVEPFDLHHALAACVKLVTPAALAKSLALTLDIAADVPRFVAGDGLRLRQVVLNLLGNATKFTETGSVALSVSRDGPLTVLTVADTGIGIPEDRRAAIFEQFVQAEGATAARYGGTGLGLSISAQLVRMMGGELAVESRVGEGSVFTLSLPLAAATQPDSRPVATAAEAAPAGPASARLLVAEDHDVNRMLVVAMLDRLGLRHALAHDGLQAVDAVLAARDAGDPFSLVLMDMQMPELDGVTATARLRALGVTAAELPILAVTANAYADDVARCLAAGMQGHLAKPVRLGELKAAVARWSPGAKEGATAPSAPDADVAARYRARRAEALDRIGAIVRDGGLTDVTVAEVADLLHKLAGTAAMFGEAALGDEAAAVEAGLRTAHVTDRLRCATEGYAALRRAAG